MGPHNLGTVVGFEFVRTLRKRSFWIATLAVPVLIAVIFGLSYASNSSTAARTEQQSSQRVSFVYTDASGLIEAQQAAVLGGSLSDDPARAAAAARAGKIQTYFAYPAHPDTEPVQVYARDLGLFSNGRYAAVAQRLLRSAVEARIGDPEFGRLATQGAEVETTTYADGQPSGGLGSVIPPLLYLVVFYFVILFLGNQMLSSTLEEKENRVTEMILTTLNATTLIVGKVVALFAVGLVQMLVFATPVVVALVFFRNSISIPSFDLSTLAFDPPRMVVGALLLLGSFVLFSGTLVAVGAVMPTAKEAGAIFGALIALLFVPFYAISLIVSDPHSVLVAVFTYFPYTAPFTAMIRNGFGSLPGWEAGVVAAELLVLGLLVLGLAVRLFRFGSIQYTSKVSIRSVLRRPRSIPGPERVAPGPEEGAGRAG